VYLPPIGRCVA